MDNTLDSLIIPSGSDSESVLSFGRFERLIRDIEPYDYSGPLGSEWDLFADFDPEIRPILWRILAVQNLLYDLLMYISRNETKEIKDIQGRVKECAGESRKHMDIDHDFENKTVVDTAISYLDEQVFQKFIKFIRVCPPRLEDVS